MVYFKVTDGEVTRKFKVNPGEVTYDQLKERVASLFPKCLKDGGKDLHLKYRDADGDVITISTDEEFQEALAELPSEHVWMLHIHGANPKSQERQAVPSDFFFRPSHSLGLFSDPWHGFGRHHHFGNPWMSNPWASTPWSSLHHVFDKMLDEHTQELNAVHNTEKAAEASPNQGEGEIAKSASGQLAPGLQVKNFGSWEPKTFDGPFGKGRIIGPVGYYMSWSSGPEEGKEEKKEEQQTADEDTKDMEAEKGSDPPAEEVAKDMDTDTQQ